MLVFCSGQKSQMPATRELMLCCSVQVTIFIIEVYLLEVYFIADIINLSWLIQYILRLQYLAMKVENKWEEVHEALAQKYLNTEVINEYDYIRSQNQILSSIKQMLERKKQHSIQFSNSHEFGTIEASSISQVSYPYDDSLIKSKFTEQFQQSIITAALKDVKSNCSEETYETVKQYIEGNKQKQFQASEKKLDKLREERDDIASQMVILKMEKTNVEKQLERYKRKCDQIEEQKRKLKTRMDFVMEKQNRLHKLQTSFTFKEKISLELKKRYERLRDMSMVTVKKIEQMHQELNSIWNEICQKCEVTSCPGNCWRKDVLSKCKQQLIQQRQMLKEESEHIEKEYEVMNTVALQFKKIFQDPQTKSQISVKT